MTWLGNPDNKPTDAAKEKLEAKRAALVTQLTALVNKGPAGRFAHNVRHFEEDKTKLAKEITKIDQKLGRPVDRNT